MKKLKGFLALVLVFISALMVLKTKCYAEEVQYTENVIPTMTSNTSPSGIASASSEWTTKDYYPAYLAFDKITSTQASAWATAKGVSTGWLAYEFPEKKCITKYTIEPRDVTGFTAESPKDWTFEAWDKQSNTWVVLDTHKNVTDWEIGVKKEFTFSNTVLYNKYRINVTANGNNVTLTIGDLEMMETVSTPLHLQAIEAGKNVQLSWTPVINAEKYIIKRSTTKGGQNDPAKTVATTVSGSAVSFTDTNIKLGVTYYYVISAVVSGKESANSNEVSITISTGDTWITGDRAILVVTMTNGTDKEYDLSASEIDAFINWYDAKSSGTGKSYFAIPKYGNVKPFINRKEFLNYYKIDSFEVKDYNA